MYKALLVALIGLFFSSATRADVSFQWSGSDGSKFYVQSTNPNDYINTICSSYGGVHSGASYPKVFSCRGSVYFNFVGSVTCSISGDPTQCNPPVVLCPNGAAAPDNDISKCPINCDILNGPTDPSCDSETPPDGFCGPNQTPVFDDCDYGPDDPRNPNNQPDPEDHCEQFPDSVSCNTELPPFAESDYCKQYPTALECKTPEIPDLGTGTGTGTTPPIGPPPAGGTGTGTDTGSGTPTPPPPAPPPTSSNNSSHSTDARLDALRYDISRLHSGLNYQTNVIATGLTGVSSQLQANGAKTDRSNTLLDGINKNLDVLNGNLKGDPLTSGNFDVEGGINSTLGITGNESIADLTDEPVRLQDYRAEFEPFLTNAQCPENIPVSFSIFGFNNTYQLYYKPVCDFMGIAGTVLNWAVWLSVPFIVFGRRRAS